MKNKLLLILVLSVFTKFSAEGALEELKGLEAKRSAAEFRDLRDFDHLSREVAKVLPSALDQGDDEQVIFSLLRTRHHFFGMPKMVTELSGSQNEKLILLDALAVHAWRDKKVESFWRTGIQESCYDSKIFEAIEEDFEDESGFSLSGDLLKRNKVFLDAAFFIHEIFAPKISLEEVWSELCVSSTPFRGWSVNGLEQNPFLIQDPSDRDHVLERISKEPFIQIKSLTARGVIQEGLLKVQYLFKPWIVEEDASVTFSLEKGIEYIKDKNSVKRFAQERAIISEKEKIFPLIECFKTANFQSTTLKEACFSRDPSKKKTEYEKALFSRRGDMIIHYQYGRLLREKDPQEAKDHLKLSADMGLSSAQDHYGTLSKKENPSKARLYFKWGSLGKSPYAMFHYAEMLIKGEGGKKNSEKALLFLRESSDLGHAAAPYDYALRKYVEAYKYFQKSASHNILEGMEFLNFLPAPPSVV